MSPSKGANQLSYKALGQIYPSPIPICSIVSTMLNYVFKVFGKLYFWSLKFGVKFNFGPSNLNSSIVVPQILKR